MKNSGEEGRSGSLEEQQEVDEFTPPMRQTLQAPVTVSSSHEKKYNKSPRGPPNQNNNINYSNNYNNHNNNNNNNNNGFMEPNTSVMSAPNPLNFINAPSRTVYLGNIPKDMTIEKLLDHVSCGVVEDCKILTIKNCAFITFIDENSALLFHSDSILKRLNIDGNDIKIGWGKSNLMDPIVAKRMKMDGATRNIYIGNLNINNDGHKDIFSEEKLRKDFEQFGTIDCIKYIPEKGIAFIHFTSIIAAVHAVDKISERRPLYADKKISFGKDRCAFITKLQQYNAAQFLGLNTENIGSIKQLNDRDFITNTLLQQAAATAAIATSAGGPNNLGNRTIYLGNLMKSTKIEDICNVVRGGILQNIKLIPDKNICFITFVDPTAAAQFYAMSSLHGLTIHKKRCKIGWGKHSGPLPNDISTAVGHGASRNIYVGNIDWDKPDNKEYFNEDNLRHIFEKYGEVEQINFLPEKNCCFINFTNINTATIAIDQIQQLPEFHNLKINFGKDRCGNIPQQIR